MMNKPYILHIETATPVCSVALAAGDELLSLHELDEPNIHASRLTLLAAEAVASAGLSFSDLAAVAVSKGPGSYTGLRIGVSTAKGLCYALGIPLVAVHTLDAMAGAFAKQYPAWGEDTLLLPMIDARRMEVYTAVYSPDLVRMEDVEARIIDEDSFSRYTPHNKVVLFGSGADKFDALFAGNGEVAVVSRFRNSAAHLVRLGFDAYRNAQFEDVAYFEPFYLKEFVATTPRKKG